MSKDQLQNFFINTGIKISNSDMFQIGIYGITAKQVDKLNMSEGLSTSAKLVLGATEVAVLTGLVSCVTRANVQPTISVEPGKTPSGGSENFSAIPTPDSEKLKDGSYPTEIYCSDDLALCAFHQFDSNGNALAPRAAINAKVDFNLDNNKITVTGDSFISSDNEVFIYPEENGQRGYETQQVMTVEDATIWMQNMTEKGRENMQVVIDEAQSKGTDVRIIMKTVLNIQKDASGNDKLVDMVGGLAMGAGYEGATVIELSDTMEPITDNDILKDQQIGAIDFVPQFDGTDNLTMEVYPSDWVEIGNGQYVSPEFIKIQDQIASTGEKFSVTPDGKIQETSADGTKDIAGLSIDKRGQITIDVNGEKVLINSTALVVSDQGGLKIDGYTFDTQTGLWSQEVIKEFTICTPEEFRKCVITEEDIKGPYLRWLQTLSKPFDTTKIKNVPLYNYGGEIYYDVKTSPNFNDPETAPFRRDVTAAHLIIERDGKEYDYIVMPIEYFDPNEPTKNKWVITVNANYSPGYVITEAIEQNVIRIWREEMNVTPIETSDIVPFLNIKDPLVSETFEKFPYLNRRFPDGSPSMFDQFISGDFGVLSQPGVIVLTSIFTGGDDWFR